MNEDREKIVRRWKRANQPTLRVNDAFTRMMSDMEINPRKVIAGADEIFKVLNEISEKQLVAVQRYGASKLFAKLMSDIKTMAAANRKTKPRPAKR